MDVSTITDMVQLKALAYEQLVAIERSQANLRVVQQRIAELQTAVAPDETTRAEKPATKA